jgi:hypothetical protein
MKLNLIEPEFLMNESIGKFPVLDEYSLRQLTPSIFSEKTKDKFLDFTEIIDMAADNGWKPVYAVEKPSTKFKNQGNTPAFIKFRNENMQLSATEDLFPELLLRVNPNNDFTSLESGYLFRQVCSNGLIRGEGEQKNYNISMGRNSYEQRLLQFMNSFGKVNDNFSQIMLPVNLMKEIELSEKQKIDFAFKSKTKARLSKVNAAELLVPRRIEDEGSVLWNVFNRVQENVMSNLPSGLHIELNQQLWGLAEQFAK